MAIHQISVFLENRAGQLAEITALLAKNNIDLRAINIAETSDYGVLRLIASHEPEACRVLRENGFIFSASEVVAVGVPDEPGGLSCACRSCCRKSRSTSNICIRSSADQTGWPI